LTTGLVAIAGEALWSAATGRITGSLDQAHPLSFSCGDHPIRSVGTSAAIRSSGGAAADQHGVRPGAASGPLPVTAGGGWPVPHTRRKKTYHPISPPRWSTSATGFGHAQRLQAEGPVLDEHIGENPNRFGGQQAPAAQTVRRPAPRITPWVGHAGSAEHIHPQERAHSPGRSPAPRGDRCAARLMPGAGAWPPPPLVGGFRVMAATVSAGHRSAPDGTSPKFSTIRPYAPALGCRPGIGEGARQHRPESTAQQATPATAADAPPPIKGGNGSGETGPCQRQCGETDQGLGA